MADRGVAALDVRRILIPVTIEDDRVLKTGDQFDGSHRSQPKLALTDLVNA